MIKFFENITMEMVESEHQDMATKMVLLGIEYHKSRTTHVNYYRAIRTVDSMFMLWREWQRLVAEGK